MRILAYAIGAAAIGAALALTPATATAAGNNGQAIRAHVTEVGYKNLYDGDHPRNWRYRQYRRGYYYGGPAYYRPYHRRGYYGYYDEGTAANIDVGPLHLRFRD